MPIYAYQCTECGHKVDKFQKLGDPPISLCPACNSESLKKQVTAAAFQLKGSGWYETDFKNKKSKTDNETTKKTDTKTQADSSASTKPTNNNNAKPTQTETSSD